MILIIRELLRIIYISLEVTGDIDELVKTSTLTLNETHIHEKNISDVHDALVEFSTPIYDDIYVSDDNTSDSEHILVV